MENRPLMQCGPNRAVQPIFQVQGALILDDVRKKIAEKCGVLGEQCRQVKGALGGDQGVEPDLAWRYIRPFLGRGVSVLRVGTSFADSLENHPRHSRRQNTSLYYPARPEPANQVQPRRDLLSSADVRSGILGTAEGL